MISDKVCTGKAFLWCVYGYVQLSDLLDRKNIHIPDTEMFSQYYGSVCAYLTLMTERMFLHTLHMQKISFQSVENCDFLSLMLERMFPYKYCTDEAFPWCVLNCV